jgi:hypothetical protein
VEWDTSGSSILLGERESQLLLVLFLLCDAEKFRVNTGMPGKSYFGIGIFTSSLSLAAAFRHPGQYS